MNDTSPLSLEAFSELAGKFSESEEILRDHVDQLMKELRIRGLLKPIQGNFPFSFPA